MGTTGGKVFSMGGQGTRQAREGDKVPAIAFKVRIKSGDGNCFDWKEIKTTDLFKGKRVVVFGVPGGEISYSMLLSLVLKWFTKYVQLSLQFALVIISLAMNVFMVSPHYAAFICLLIFCCSC